MSPLSLQKELEENERLLSLYEKAKEKELKAREIIRKIKKDEVGLG